MRRVSIGLLLAAASCGGVRASTTPGPPRPTVDGAILLAHPGAAAAFVVAGAPTEIVRGRVRWHVEPDGTAVRAADVLARPVQQAVAVPPWLGGGIALLSEDGWSLAHSSTVRPLARGAFAGASIAADALFTRERPDGDFVRIALPCRKEPCAARALPPVQAPLSSSHLATAGVGHPPSLGFEFVGPQAGVALVDLLGPVRTQDRGESWAPFDASAVGAAFLGAPPQRLVRRGTSVQLESDESAAPISAATTIGPSAPLPRAATVLPDAAAIRLEVVAPHGVPVDDAILVADGARLAIARLDPPRIVRVGRADDATRCDLRRDLRRGGRALAVAVCARLDVTPASAGAQLVVGTVVDDSGGPRVVVEKVFPYGSAHRFAASSAVAIAGSCAGLGDGGIDLLAATRICVRAADATYRDFALTGVHGRRAVLPTADGGLVVLREDPKTGREILRFPPGSSTAAPLRITLESATTPRSEVLGIDEDDQGTIVLWQRRDSTLAATLVDLRGLRAEPRPPREIDPKRSAVGTYGGRALVVEVPSGTAIPRLAITTDAGRIWHASSWPDRGAPILDGEPAQGRSVECGLLGCRLLGWSRIGWSPTLAAHDRVVDGSDAPALDPQPPESPRSAVARCRETAPPEPVDRALVPRATFTRVPSFGLPPVKAPPGYVVDVAALASDTVRGAVHTMGPAAASAKGGAWGDHARVVVRFATDLDPLDGVHETLASPPPFDSRFRAVARMHAHALGPGRALLVSCDGARCELLRAVAGAPLERLDLPNVRVERIVGAREAHGVLVLLGLGAPVAPSGARGRSTPFVASIGAHGVAVSTFARASWSEPSTAEPTIDGQGTLGLVLPSIVGAFVLPLGDALRPTGGFETLGRVGVQTLRPTRGCGGASAGWARTEAAGAAAVFVMLEGQGATRLLRGQVVMRTRVGEQPCVDRITAVGDDGAFQLDAAGRGTLLTLEPDERASRRSLACTLDWE